MFLTLCLLSFSVFGAFAEGELSPPQYAMDCKYKVPGKDVSYDLENFPNGKIIVPPTTSFAHNSFYYVIGVCNNLFSFPDDPDGGHSYCKETQNYDGSKIILEKPGAAYRYRPEDKLCQLIGKDAADGKLVLDIDDFGGDSNRWANMYSRGVELRYSGGNKCLVNNREIERSVSVFVECDSSAGLLTPMRVSETSSCKYDIVVPSVQGCPLQCRPHGSTHVCNDHGICGFDTAANKAKCYCFDGWTGQFCDKHGFVGPAPPKSYSSRVAGGLFGGILLGLALAVIAFMVRAKLNGGQFVEGLDFARTFPTFFGGAVAKAPSMDGFYAATPAGSGLAVDAPSTYVAPDMTGTAPSGVLGGAPENDHAHLIA